MNLVTPSKVCRKKPQVRRIVAKDDWAANQNVVNSGGVTEFPFAIAMA